MVRRALEDFIVRDSLLQPTPSKPRLPVTMTVVLFGTLTVMLLLGSLELESVGPLDLPRPATSTNGFARTMAQRSSITVQPGCYSASYAGVQRALIGCGLLPSFGVPTFDAAFREESLLQDAFFQRFVLVAAFDECPGVMNALSIPGGVVLFGKNLAFNVVFSTSSGTGVAGILAHEYAHQLQFDNGWQRPSDPTVRATELEADAFSGLYIGLVKGFDEEELLAYFQTLFAIGDYAFNDPKHHGTPQDRVAAGLLGLIVADDIITNNYTPTWHQLHNFFIGFIVDSNRVLRLMRESRAGLRVSGETYKNLELIQNGEIPDLRKREPDDRSRRHLYPR